MFVEVRGGMLPAASPAWKHRQRSLGRLPIVLPGYGLGSGVLRPRGVRGLRHADLDAAVAAALWAVDCVAPGAVAPGRALPSTPLPGPRVGRAAAGWHGLHDGHQHCH